MEPDDTTPHELAETDDEIHEEIMDPKRRRHLCISMASVPTKLLDFDHA